MKKIKTPLTKEKVKNLKAGDNILLSGTIYTARDQAHKRLNDLIKKGKDLPFNLKNQIIYYVGPAPAKPGEVIGSAGPTTSYRMDDLTIPLLKLGLKGMIGKGTRSKEVIKAMKDTNSLYFAAIGGAGALISDCIISSKVIAFEDLQTEAIRKLEVKDLPLIVVIDSNKNNLYEIERKKFKA
ncbi:MAG: Fe-S-containing hydro-lyase [Bacillota bacterium]